MLSKKYRLTTALLSEVLSKGTIFHGEHFLIRVFPVNTSNYSKETKFGIIIPKKLIKTSVERHWYKRRIYSALDSYTKNSIPFYVLVSLKRKPIKRENLKIKAELDTLLAQLIKRA